MEGYSGYGRCLSCGCVWELEGLEEEMCSECGCTFSSEELQEFQTISAELERLQANQPQYRSGHDYGVA